MIPANVLLLYSVILSGLGLIYQTNGSYANQTNGSDVQNASLIRDILNKLSSHSFIFTHHSLDYYRLSCAFDHKKVMS